VRRAVFVGSGFEAPISEVALGLRLKPRATELQGYTAAKDTTSQSCRKKAKSAGRSVLVATLEAQ
jgi:hypothetical protein